MLMYLDVNEISVDAAFSEAGDLDLLPLVLNIQRNGLIVPIYVTRKKDGTLILLTGLRRLEAVKALGWQMIAANFVEL